MKDAAASIASIILEVNENERKWRTSCISFCGCVKGLSKLQLCCITDKSYVRLKQVSWDVNFNTFLGCMHHGYIFSNLEVKTTVIMIEYATCLCTLP